MNISISIGSRKAESAIESSPPSSSGNPSEVSSLDEHQVEEDQHHGRWSTNKGEVFESEDTIILEDVPIVTPNKDEVATGLNFEVREVLYLLCSSDASHDLNMYMYRCSIANSVSSIKLETQGREANAVCGGGGS